ncbi:pyridoxal-phosphate-dependent aminotransferase family protein [Spirabiliibacterium pneumoniae]|uniref:pyridoxal-phosphate-dependent aminotransferase family protein n=1 Tax=Spirabiliibacterium pneumoniae TaxID=221400 RepID=UPI001F161BA7|nr:aminotransferase class V-fold PLP-dependent enzyme [Spirabiliibacterium pneumoniae]
MIYENYTILTPGPVKMSDRTLTLGAKQVPYFRNQPFSDVVLGCESLLLEMVNSPSGSRAVFLTASGTAGMESVVMNLLDSDDNALVINGGTFGQRFVHICNQYDIPSKEINPNKGNLSDIDQCVDGSKYSACLVNAHETSIGLLYDLEAIGKFCHKHNMLNIVDAISMFTTDKLDMTTQFIDVVIMSSQKGLALPPGLTVIILSPNAIEKLNNIRGLYFNFKQYLKDGERGQTPYTPAVSIIIQLYDRLTQIKEDGGIEQTIKNAFDCSFYFRDKIKHLPLSLNTDFPSNGLTALTMNSNHGAKKLLSFLEEKYKIIACPNGGELSDILFRVSHMGFVNKTDMEKLIEALEDFFNSESE